MLDEITLDVIDRIKSERLKTVNKPTVNRYLPLVRAILLRARDEWEWIDKTPKVKLFKEGTGRERSITVEQAQTLLGELPVQQRDVVLFALATGLRQSNVLGLECGRAGRQDGHDQERPEPVRRRTRASVEESRRRARLRRVGHQPGRERVDDLAVLNAAQVEAIYAPPALEPTDINGGADDREIRAWVATLDSDRRAEFLTQMVRGKQPRIALALARSPVPTMEQEMGYAALRANLPEMDREQLRELDTQRATQEWARSAVGSMRNALSKKLSL